MDHKEIPPELLSAVGRLLRQGRTSRKLSPTEAADLVGAPIEFLDSLENGLSPMTTEQAQFIVAKYGGVRGDIIDGMILRLVMEKSRCEQQTQQRKHLSIVGNDPRPWEKLHLSKLLNTYKIRTSFEEQALVIAPNKSENKNIIVFRPKTSLVVWR